MMLPNGWKKVGLFDVVSIESALVDPKIKPYSELYLIAPDHIQSETGVILAQVPAKEQHAISGKYLVKAGDVIYSKIRPYLKKACRANEECLCSADMYPLSSSEEIDANYLLQLLLSENFTKYANSCSARTGIPKINREDLALYKFFLPPLEEQKKIAETLSVWDNAIEKTEKLIALKETEYQANVSALIFENRKFAQKCKIGDVLEIRNIRATATDDRPLYSLTIEDGVTPKSERYDRLALVKDKDSKKYKVVCDGDIVFNPANLRWGAIARANLDRDVVVSPIYEVLYVKGKEFDAKYISQYLTSEKMISYYATKTEGTLIERKEVKLDAFLQIDIYVEKNIENQIKIADILDSAKKEINLLKQQLGNYKKQKQGLMQKLLTGQWRVK